LDAAPPPEKRSKLQQYRLVLLAVGALVSGAFAVLVTASIVIELFAGRRGAGSARPDTAEQLACNQDVQRLLDRLVREASRIQLMPLEGIKRLDEVAAGWDQFSLAWDESWRAAEERCQFDRFAESGLGVAFDRTARVHGALPMTKLKYAEQMARFTHDLAAEVAEMRRALDKSHDDLATRGAESKD
jgi:hypothetical protein